MAKEKESKSKTTKKAPEKKKAAPAAKSNVKKK